MPTMPIGDGRHVYYAFDRADDADAQAVMLVHGLAESGEAWADWMPHLRAGSTCCGRTCVATASRRPCRLIMLGASTT